MGSSGCPAGLWKFAHLLRRLNRAHGLEGEAASWEQTPIAAADQLPARARRRAARSAPAPRSASTRAANSPLRAQHRGAQHHVPPAPGRPAAGSRPKHLCSSLFLEKKKKKKSLCSSSLCLSAFPRTAPGTQHRGVPTSRCRWGWGARRCPKLCPGPSASPCQGAAPRAGGLEARTRPCSAASRCRVCSCRCPAPAGSTSAVAAPFFFVLFFLFFFFSRHLLLDLPAPACCVSLRRRKMVCHLD